MTTISRLGGLLAITLLAAACTSGGSLPIPTLTPDVDAPVATDPASDAPPSVDQPGGGDFVVPKPGQLDVHPVRLDSLVAGVDGRRVVVTAGWTSGVEPCNVLDTIVVDRGDHAFALTFREGHSGGEIACIEIAVMKQAQVDLGELEPGTYTISDSQGGAAPIEVTVT